MYTLKVIWSIFRTPY